MKQVAAFREGRLGLPHLVSQLDVGIEALVEHEPNLAAALKDPWRVLEELNALALDEGRAEPLEDHRENAERALSRVVSSITEALHG